MVSFVFHNAPQSFAREDVRILETGCGAGSDLWFAAREGFKVTYIDGSARAIEYSMERFALEGLVGDFHVGELSDLPIVEECFDLAIDRTALTYTRFSVATRPLWRFIVC